MVSFSALTGYFLTGNLDGFVTCILFFGVFLLAAGSAALNQVQERSFDLLMERTKYRPLPSNQISVVAALAVSMILLMAGALLLSLIGWLPMTLGIINLVLYNLIYTPLKRITWLAIIPGSLVGTVPPLIGWTSIGLSVFHPVILFVAVFVLLWQAPHFWLILIRYSRDYENAGFSRLPVYLDGNRIKILVFLWALVTSGFLCSFPLFGLKFNSPLIALFLLLNLLFIFFFYKFLFGKEVNQPIRKAFILINSFAFAILVLLIFGNH
jgi:protoheme IX farnesyltransferase